MGLDHPEWIPELTVLSCNGRHAGKILNFFDMPISEKRLECLFKHKDGLFHREPTKAPEVVPFNEEIRSAMDNVISHVNEKGHFMSLLVKDLIALPPLH